MVTFDCLEALACWLDQLQAQRETLAVFRLKTRMSDQQLHQAMDTMLPMAGRQSRRIRRDRGGVQVRITLGYREGVRIADAWKQGKADMLNEREYHTLIKAQELAEAALQSGNVLETLQKRLLAALTYTSPSHGRPGYSAVVHASAAMLEGRANCQGISDAMYLLGTLAGLQMGYQAGKNARGAHLWNKVQVDGVWRHLDVTAALNNDARTAEILLTDAQAREKGLIWPAW